MSFKRSSTKQSKSTSRIQKFLAESGEYSRRKAEIVIRAGKVRVNDKVVTDPAFMINPENDRVDVKGKSVRLPHKGVALFYKPRGVVSTLSDPEGRPCIGDFLTRHYRSYYPVGRLDWDSSGLVVLTNDGDLAERLMHPRYGLERIYHARVEGSVSAEVLTKIRRGVKLHDGFVKGIAEILESNAKATWLEIKVGEGRNRMVRRLFDRLRHPVIKLRRIAHGPFKLGKLRTGQIRRLPEDEYKKVRTQLIKPDVRISKKTGLS